MAASDESLVVRCRGGDEEAWSQLVDRYQRLVYAIPRRAGLDEDLAGDVFQHVFAKLVENIGRIERPSQLHAWVVTTAKRETLRLLERERRERLPSEGPDGGNDFDDRAARLPDGAPLPDEALQRIEEEHAVGLALGRLDERCRRLLTLLFYEDEPPPYSEITRLTGIKAGGIGPTRGRCLDKLLKLLEEAGVRCIFQLAAPSVLWTGMARLCTDWICAL
jgi:RNA polymerase sigma factor (sigma-70 family)